MSHWVIVAILAIRSDCPSNSESILFEEFQNYHHGGHLGYWNRTILAFLNPQCLPLSFGSIRFILQEQMRLKKYFYYGCHLGYWNWTILGILNLHVTPMPPIKFCSVPLTFWEEMWFEDFKMATIGHLGYRNRTILAILNLHVTPMPPTEFQPNPTYDSSGDVKNVKS